MFTQSGYWKHLKSKEYLLFLAFTWFWTKQRLCVKVYRCFWPRREQYFSCWVNWCRVCNYQKVFCCVCKIFTERMWLCFNRFYVAFRPWVDRLAWVFSIFIILSMPLPMRDLLFVMFTWRVIIWFNDKDFILGIICLNSKHCREWVRYNNWFLRWKWAFWLDSRFAWYVFWLVHKTCFCYMSFPPTLNNQPYYACKC